MIPLLLSLLISSNEVEQYSKRLQELEKQLQKTQKKVSTLKKQERNIKRELNYLREQENTLVEIIQVMEKQHNDLKVKLKRIEQAILRGKRVTEFWYKSLETATKSQIINLLAEQDPIVESVSETLSELSVKRLNRYQRELEKLQELKRQRKRVLQTAEKITKKLETKYKNLTDLRRKKDILIKKVRTERLKEQKKQREIEEAKRELEKLIKELAEKSRRERERTGTPEVKLAKGKIVWPVKGKIVSNFGTHKDPKYGTKVRNNGIDILSEPGALIRSAAAGVVVYSGPFMNYQNVVIIDHSGFMTVYAFLDQVMVKPDQIVKVGEPVGRLSVGQPIFHFEVRKQGKAVDPLSYLR